MTPGTLINEGIFALALFICCSSKPLVSIDGRVGAAGASDGGASTADTGGSPTGGSSGVGGATAGMQGCYIGRKFDGDITTVACSNAPGTLVAATSYLYWLAWGVDGDSTRGTLVSALKTGGALRPLAVIEDSSPTLRASGTHLFWTDWKVQKDDRAGVVGSVPLQGGPATTLADDLFLPNGLALDETYAYFGTVDGIFRVPQSGGDVEFIADALAWRMQVVDGMVYWLDHKSVPTELGLRESMAIFRVPADGGKEPELLLRTFDHPGSLIVVGDRVFWTTNAQGEIWSMPLAGGTPTVVLENPLACFAAS